MTEVTETARARVAKLVSDWDWPNPAVLEGILALGDEAVPALAAVLTPELLEAVKTDEDADTLVYYGLELLAALGTPAALSVFMHAYPYVTDDTVEGLETALQSLGPEAVESLIALAAKPSLSYYARALAINGAVHEANKNAETRLRVIVGLRAILTGYVERTEPLTADEKDVVASVIVHLAELNDAEARPLIDAAFAAGLVQTAEESEIGIPITDQEDIDRVYQKGDKVHPWNPPPFLEDYRKRWQANQDQEQTQIRLGLLPPPANTSAQPKVLDPRLGRNDPCWCGSGKKYKKCHLAQDEKEKVRL
jgi:predicted hotdog family 3-hydroxylacyl-ACP dehydratase